MSAEKTSWLAHFPVTFFAMVMGLAGLTLALHAAHGATQGGLAEALALGTHLALLLTLGVALALAGVYAAKWLRHADHARAEWTHPVKIAFFPALSISLLLIATALLPFRPRAAEIIWWAGMLAQGALTLAVISSWISHRAFEQGHLTPAWFIPAVGNVVVPVGGAQLGWIEISWLFFSAGLLFWVVLLTLVFNRLIFHNPLPGRLAPTLVILIAPPAVAFISWVRLTGGSGPFGHILFDLGLVFAAVVAVQAPKLAQLPFALSFWALSFPLAALTISTFLHAKLSGVAAYAHLGFALLALLVVVILGLLIRTARAMAAGEICAPEGPPPS